MGRKRKVSICGALSLPAAPVPVVGLELGVSAAPRAAPSSRADALGLRQSAKTLLAGSATQPCGSRSSCWQPVSLWSRAKVALKTKNNKPSHQSPFSPSPVLVGSPVPLPRCGLQRRDRRQRGRSGAGLLLTFPPRVPSQLAGLEQPHMKYDDFLLKRRRRGRGREDRWLPMVCMPGAARRTGRSGAAAPRGWPLAPGSLTRRMSLSPRWAGMAPGEAAAGARPGDTQLWGSPCCPRGCRRYAVLVSWRAELFFFKGFWFSLLKKRQSRSGKNALVLCQHCSLKLCSLILSLMGST